MAAETGVEVEEMTAGLERYKYSAGVGEEEGATAGSEPGDYWGRYNYSVEEFFSGYGFS